MNVDQGRNMSIFSLFSRKGPTGFGYASTAEEVTAGLNLAGKTVLVTGCNSGLGQETMRVLALRGAGVIGTARTLAKAKEAAAKCGAVGLECELSDSASVRACVAAVRAMGVGLDAIVANAGIMALPELATAMGYELQFVTNHIGHFILVTGLEECLSADGRVVMLSSSLHSSAPAAGIDFDNLDGAKGYRPWEAYGQSKMANLLFAKELSRRFAGTGRTAYAVHPGVITTNLARSLNPVLRNLMAVAGPLMMKSIPQGAATECFCAVHPAAPALSGNYFADCNVATCRADGNDAALARRLWDLSLEIAA